MKKIAVKSKKILAVFVLMFMVIYAAVPTVQAANSYIKSGGRGAGYCSWTDIKGYDNGGNALSMAAGAEYCGEWGFGYGKPRAYASSPTNAVKTDAYHAYGVVTVNFNTKWKQN